MSALREFENPKGNWTHEGPFHVHIRSQALSVITWACEDVIIDGTIIRVGELGLRKGRAAQGIGGIQFCAGDQSFYLCYNNLIRLCRPSGQLIWQNHLLTGVVMQEVGQRPHGAWPMFYHDGKRIIGQIGDSGPWYQLNVGQQVKFDRHGTFRFTECFKTSANLDVTLPRKGWNPTRATCRIRIPTGKCLHVARSDYYLEWMNQTWLWKGFGYKTGHEPIRETEIDELVKLMNLGTLIEVRARQAMAKMEPKEVRDLMRNLRLAALRSMDIRAEVNVIKQQLSLSEA